MFDLEKSIADWRKQIAAGGIRTPEVLNELESHLRDDMQQEIQAGLSPQQAFESAAARIGGAQALNTEFAKLARAHNGFMAWLKRFLMMQPGTLLAPAVPPLCAFTPHAQQTLELARAEAPRLNHDFIGTEHVLLGLLNSPAGIVRDIMRRMGVEAETVRKEIAILIGPGLSAQRIATSIPYTPRVIRALTLAAKEAKALKQSHVTPGHILLGLLKEGEGVAAIVLRKLGVDMNKLQEIVRKEI